MTMRSSLRCPHCGSGKLSVLKTRFRKDGCIVWRKRKCDDCGKRFATEAAPETVVHLVK